MHRGKAFAGICITLAVFGMASVVRAGNKSQGLGFAGVDTLQPGDRFVYRVLVPTPMWEVSPGRPPGPRVDPIRPEDVDTRFLRAEVMHTARDGEAVHVRMRIVEVTGEGAVAPHWDLERRGTAGERGDYYALNLTTGPGLGTVDFAYPFARDAGLFSSTVGLRHPFLGYPPFTQVPSGSAPEATLLRSGTGMKFAAVRTEQDRAELTIQYYRRVQWSDQDSYEDVLYLDQRTGELLEDSPRPPRPPLTAERDPHPRLGKPPEYWEGLRDEHKERRPEDVIAVRPVDSEEQVWEAGMPLPSEVFRKTSSGHLRMKLTLIERPERYGPIESEE